MEIDPITKNIVLKPSEFGILIDTYDKIYSPDREWCNATEFLCDLSGTAGRVGRNNNGQLVFNAWAAGDLLGIVDYQLDELCEVLNGDNDDMELGVPIDVAKELKEQLATKYKELNSLIEEQENA